MLNNLKKCKAYNKKTDIYRGLVISKLDAYASPRGVL